MRVVFMIKKSDHKCSTLCTGSCKRYDLSKLVSFRVLLLREQVRDLRVQEFLRELVVGVTAPSDLEG